MKIIVVGLGLIGGSFAKAIKARTAHTVFGANRTPAVLDRALEAGAIDGVCTPQDLADCDVLILCQYPEAAAEYLRVHAGEISPSAVVTDACGVKRTLYRALDGVLRDAPFAFVGAHPMAGRAKSGFDASLPDLFEGASLILTPNGAPDWAVNRVRELAGELGFGRVVLTTPEQHDRMIAYTSQLPHVLACSYIADPLAPEHAGFSAGSFQDITRVASINEEMWTGLFLDNRDYLSAEIGTLIQNLDAFRAALDRGDAETLEALMRESRLRKAALSAEKKEESQG